MNKKVLIVGGLLTGCLLFAGCSPATGSTYEKESAKLQQNQTVLTNAVPIPTLQTSQERLNIKRRAELFDNENKVSYIYLMSYGKVMAFYTVKGKVSSLRSYMTPQEQLVNYQGIPCNDATRQSKDGKSAATCGGSGAYSVQSPDVDGSYGENVDGVFFFTTENAYVEWKGEYMMSDQPLQMSTKPELVRNIK